MKARSWAKAQAENVARCERRTVARRRMCVRSSNAIARFVSFALATISLERQWLVWVCAPGERQERDAVQSLPGHDPLIVGHPAVGAERRADRPVPSVSFANLADG